MQPHAHQNLPPQTWLTLHPQTGADAAVLAALRPQLEPHKGQLQGTAARTLFDQIMGHTPAAEGVTYERDTVGGVAGWWCRPAKVHAGAAILYLHGGWYVWGSAQAYRHLVGQIAARSGTAAFVADYRLAPEHPFPAALLDAQACYRGLMQRGLQRIALVGDSAGGGLALVLSSLAAQEGVRPVGTLALSPVTDLTLSGPSWKTRATAELYFTRPQAEALIESYLGGHDPADPLASPLYGALAGLSSVRLHVGEDEQLLDDSRRYVAEAVAAGVDARLEVWQGMPHVFQSGVGAFGAAAESLDALGAFLAERLAGDGAPRQGA